MVQLQHFVVSEVCMDDLGTDGPDIRGGGGPAQQREACPSLWAWLSQSFGIYYHCYDMWAANEGTHSISSQLISPHVVWIRLNNIS